MAECFILFNPTLHEAFDQRMRHGRAKCAPPLSHSQTKRSGNTKFGMGVGVHQIFLEKLVFSG